MPIATATVAKAPPIPISKRNFLGKVEAEGELVCESGKLDDKLTAGVRGVGARAGIGVDSGVRGRARQQSLSWLFRGERR